MSLHRWLRNLRSARKPRRGSKRATTHRPNLEILEDRCLLSFSPITDFAVGSSPQAVATGDFNNDDHLDLATANYSDGTVSVRLGDGQGGFGDEHTFEVGSNPVSLVAGDFNGDGNLDLATAHNDYFYYGSSSSVDVLLGDGTGSFGSPVSTGLWTGQAQSLAVGDLDGDGKMDLAVGTHYTYFGYYYGSYDYAYVEVLMDYGQGGFASQNWAYLGGGSTSGVAVADLDGDLDADVAAVTSYGAVNVLLGNNDGSLNWTGSFAASGYPSAVAVGDFTGDDIPDLVVAGTRVEVLPGLGGGNFGSRISNSESGYWTSVAADDFNDDGNLDVVAANPSAGTVSTFLGLGDGRLIRGEEDAVGPWPLSLVKGDFNEDGRPDVGVANSSSDSVSVLLNDGDWPPLSPLAEIKDVTVTEGDTGTVEAKFTVTLSAPATRTLTIQYTTGGGTATADADYKATSGTLTFNPGDTSATITVLIYGDIIDEWDQTFYVNLSSSDVLIADAQALGTIVDNDPPPKLIISDAVPTAEGKSGTKVMNFTVTLSAPSEKGVSVYYSTAAGTASYLDNDYVRTSGWLTFGAGETTKTISVTIIGDTRREKDEKFSVLLSSASNATIADSQGIGIILDDDKPSKGRRK